MHSSGRNRKPANAWNVGKTSGKPKPNPTATDNKFKEARVKLQAAVEKYAKDYESSSSEDELESDNVIGSILKNYAQVGGKQEHLGRTQAFLEDSLASGAATCLICIGSIRRAEKIWSCTACFCFFHLQCIERWSKDSVTQQKDSLREQQQQLQRQPGHPPVASICWGCPKCRFEYSAEHLPRDYKCFCAKTVDPPHHPWLVPHSCGEMCGKPLVPTCGHSCVLLCHPGPCPPCPKTVSVSCYCGGRAPRMQRCSSKEWSCSAPCGKTLACGKHPCPKPCHAGACPPCKKRSTQRCQCGGQEEQRACASAEWQCGTVCGKMLACGSHPCPDVCHAGACGQCVLALPRACPCGKARYQLPCIQDTPTCGDTCGKLLECGAHNCNQRCHKDKCGTCLELAVKRCRCGLHEKEVQCKKPYLCETKCKQIRDCNKHACNRKCCDGNCPPCEKPCGRTLPCGLHKCGSVCHRGPCYPCPRTTEVKCRCAGTVLTVPCGRKKRTRPPPCSRPCTLPPDCHHEARAPHRCHFGPCPPCRQPCAQPRSVCAHACPASCHTAALVRVAAQQARCLLDEVGPRIEKRCLPCPECVVPVPVTCLGGHETCEWPCHTARPASCHRPCGRALPCGNHACELACHSVVGGVDNESAGANCEACERPCTRPRPPGCQHACPRPCHPGRCPPCALILRLKCHCGLNQPYVQCSVWTATAADQDQLRSCGNQCPRNFDCGHRCKADCHPGAVCPNADLCKKKVKVTCACKRIKREFSCELVRRNAAQVDCDEQCAQKLRDEQRMHEDQAAAKRRAEELRNARELEQFQKKFHGKKKYRERKISQQVQAKSMLRSYWLLVAAVFVALLAVYVLL